MSSLIVQMVEINNVYNHPNADRLDIVEVLGWQCVTQRGKYQKGDKCIYIPIDSVLPAELEAVLFPADSKITLYNHRVKTVRIRGAISQGMVVDPALLGFEDVPIGAELTSIMGIKKYSPPVSLGPQSNANSVKKRAENPDFHKYTSIENFKNYPNLFTENDEVAVFEKIHGTNVRYGILPTCPFTVWQKIKKWLGILPKYEFVYGSHNVQLKCGDDNIYWEMAKKYNLQNILAPNEIVYGEIYGDGVQKNYPYGCRSGERKFIVFDVKQNGKYLDATEMMAWAMERGLPHVPLLAIRKFDIEKVRPLTSGGSVLAPCQKHREGVVIRPTKESSCFIGRKILKLINDDYLLQKGLTEFH